MESNTLTQSLLFTTGATKTKDFIDILKDFLNESLLELQLEGAIPPILNIQKKGTPKGSKNSKKGSQSKLLANQVSDNKMLFSGIEETSPNWEFDAKDSNWEKYGNLSSPTLIKLVSKFNKQQGKTFKALEIAQIIVQRLNEKLQQIERSHEEDDEDEDNQQQQQKNNQAIDQQKEANQQIRQVLLEIQKFETLNGFLNIFLQNDQFMDRVQLMIEKKNVTYKQGILSSSEQRRKQELENDHSSAFVIKPIGYLESCFREKFGTPRQSCFVKEAKARLTLVNEINSSCLQGLSEYNYIWLIFVFHAGLHDYNPKKTKIAPPKLEGEKKGVFATRSPHRYNPIGLSIAKLDKIEDRTIYVSGIDLIHGTPVLDIKPYHYLDSLDKNELIFPNWLLESKEKGRLKVSFSEESIQELRDILNEGKLDFYKDFEEVKDLITQVFELNPHSVHTINKHKEGIYAVALDNMNIIYKMNEEKTEVNIIKIIWQDNTQPREKLRTKEWLLKINEIMDFGGNNKQNEFEDQLGKGDEEVKESNNK